MNKFMSLIVISLSALILFAGCSAEVEDTAGTDYLLAGYYMIAGDETPLVDDEAGASRATIPVYEAPYDSYTFAQWIAGEANKNKLVNYPEQGQKTYVTVTEYDADENVYLISSRTEYPNKDDLIDYYLEEYYVGDITPGNLAVDATNLDGSTPDGNWTNDDPLVSYDGTEWVIDNLSRETMEVHFQDGSVRQEWIDAVKGGDVDYAQFPIDGDLVIDPDWTPTKHSTGADWSSKVYYYQKVSSYISWFYKENKEIFGVRYYTRSDDDGDGDFISSSISFEHTVTRKVSSWGDSEWASILEWIFGDGTSASGSSTGDTLAETVIREQIIEKNKKKSVRSSTKIVPTFGDTFTIDKSMDYTF